jgi:hypothetical protein
MLFMLFLLKLVQQSSYLICERLRSPSGGFLIRPRWPLPHPLGMAITPHLLDTAPGISVGALLLWRILPQILPAAAA